MVLQLSEGGGGHAHDLPRPRRPRGRARAVRDAGGEAAAHRVHAPHRRGLHDQTTSKQRKRCPP